MVKPGGGLEGRREGGLNWTGKCGELKDEILIHIKYYS